MAAYTATNLQTTPPTWRVTGPAAAALALSPSGVLSFTRPPDYEAPTERDGGKRRAGASFLGFLGGGLERVKKAQ